DVAVLRLYVEIFFTSRFSFMAKIVAGRKWMPSHRREFLELSRQLSQCSTAARQQSCFASSNTTLRVWPRARLSDCLGIEVTRGLSSQPRPVGISRVSESASHCR